MKILIVEDDVGFSEDLIGIINGINSTATVEVVRSRDSAVSSITSGFLICWSWISTFQPVMVD